VIGAEVCSESCPVRSSEFNDEEEEVWATCSKFGTHVTGAEERRAPLYGSGERTLTPKEEETYAMCSGFGTDLIVTKPLFIFFSYVNK
jgi:hypothetical protein